MPLNAGIIVFPGSNCQRDCADAVRVVLGTEPIFFESAQPIPDAQLAELALIILPGGFSYGDYLRSGAIAKLAPVMPSVHSAAQRGVTVLGICNGFQILTESGLLPGALTHNASATQPNGFVCNRFEPLLIAQTHHPFTQCYSQGQQVVFPVAHGEGNYQAPEATLDELEANNQVLLRYARDLNGSARGIAGICNRQGNVVGLMPHPERNLWHRPELNDSGDGRRWFEGLLKALTSKNAVNV
ncbi:MAG: phosphoribosylformylglycinamidine synthase subunit PurQ [Vampirovibrionales bacterium]|nr:phosphoribosylformylglycinamidine synthase subunit PurQ [Vampirovibrionales bacterium]